MDFLSLLSEYESYKDYISNTNETMKCLSNFFYTIQNGLQTYAKTVENSLNDLLNTLLRYDHRNTYIKKFFDFFRSFQKYLIKLEVVAKKIETELVSPTIDFDKFLSEENSYFLSCFDNMITETLNQKKKYEIIKKRYFESCQLAEKQEKKLLEEMNRTGSTEESINVQNEILTELRVASQLEYQKYKDEHKITNDLYKGNNKKYYPLKNSLKDTEEKRINYLSFHLEKFTSILKEEKSFLEATVNSLTEEDEKQDNNSLTIKLNEDIKLYQSKFNFDYKPGLRFIEEEIILYDIYRRNIEALINSNNKFMDNKLRKLSNDFNITNVILSEYNQKFFEFDKNSAKQLDQNDNLIFRTLFDNNPLNINYKLVSNFENKLRYDSNFATNILNKMICEIFQNRIYYEFKNQEQYERLIHVLQNIAMNEEINNCKNKLFECNFGIIYIAEKTFYKNNISNSRRYLCSDLSEKCEIFQNKDYWKNLLKFKINSSVKKLTDKAVKETINHKHKKRLKKVKGAVKFLFDLGTGNSDSDTKNLEIRKQKEKEVRYKALISILKDFFTHFPNFNLDMVTCNDIVMEIGAEYKLEKDEMIYLISFINSNTYSIKARNQIKKVESKYLIKKILITNNLKQKNILLTLNSCFRFLQPKDYINIHGVNKLYHQICEKTIFKHIFIKDDNSPLSIDLFDINKHIGMWFHYLKYDPSKINYKLKFKEITEKKLVSIYLDNINLDVARTFFDNDQKINREKTKNILISLSIVYPDIGYCQGMSFICQFLLEITGFNEEKTFDLFSALLSKTEYPKLIINNFGLMKKYFYVFERLINIYLPDLDIILRKNNVSSGYYISPWFITLFTHSFSSNHTKLLVRIFDMFVLDGWNCIMRIGLLLLKHYQSNLLEMKFEELLQFLINDLKEKYDFFNNYNYDKFMELYNDMKIPKGLITNIENEYELNIKVEKIKKDYLESNANVSSNDEDDIEEGE